MSQPQQSIDREPLRFVELLRTMTIGDRVCANGEIVAVQPYLSAPTTIMPIDPRLYFDRANKLVRDGMAKPSTGPATAKVGHSLDPHKPPVPEVERATDPRPAEAGRAVGRPQRSGAI